MTSGIKKRAVSAANEQFIRTLLKKVDVNECVKNIQCFTAADIASEGWDNAYVSYCGDDTYHFYISEVWFETLTEKEKVFLVVHEAMHIKLGHFLSNLNPRKLAHAALLREQEREADRAAVQFLRCYRGAVAWLRRMHRARKERTMHAMTPLDTHPRFSERIALVKYYSERAEQSF